MLSGNHSLKNSNVYGDWRIHNLSLENNLILYLPDIEHLLNEGDLKEVNFDDIAWKGKHLLSKYTTENCICCDGLRYIDSDTSFPGILTETTYNPYGSKYRMLDGKHRIAKLRSQGFTKSLFYVLEYESVKNYFKERE